MSTITRKDGYRIPGILEAAYLLDNVKAEVIADGCHLPAELLKLIVKSFGEENVCLVTDAMRGAGMEEGESELGRKGESMACIIEDGVAKLPDRTSFAGSVATADRLVRTMIQKAEVPIWEAVGMITENPAKVLGLSKKGLLDAGYDADILIFDENINIKKVFVMGKNII
jgi:N-acetylglucosamine-6-phosphate deacetylase